MSEDNRSEQAASAEAKFREIIAAFVDAMAKREKLTITYEFTRQPTIQDLAEIERAINKFLVSILESVSGKKMPRRQRKMFGFDMNSFKSADDGDHDVRIILDFARMLPP